MADQDLQLNSDSLDPEDLINEIRCYSLDEGTAFHRKLWSEFDGDIPPFFKSGNAGCGRRMLLPPSSGLCRRPISPSGSGLNFISDAAKPRSSSGGRRCGSASSSSKDRSTSEGCIDNSVTKRLLRLSRDATQPTSGSMSDLRGRTPEDDEEADVLAAISPIPRIRPRAFTCPDVKTMQRKTKMKLLHRPPTPTPEDNAQTGEGLSVGQGSTSVHPFSSVEKFTHDTESELPPIAET